MLINFIKYKISFGCKMYKYINDHKEKLNAATESMKKCFITYNFYLNLFKNFLPYITLV